MDKDVVKQLLVYLILRNKVENERIINELGRGLNVELRDKLEREISQLKEEVNNLTSEVKNLRSVNSNNKEELQVLRENNKSLKLELAKTKRELDRVISDLDLAKAKKEED